MLATKVPPLHAFAPAGTGKTLSLICSSLHWLEDWRHRQEEQAAAPAAAARASQEGNIDDDEPDWLRDYAADKEREAQREAEQRRATRLAAVRAWLVQRQSKAWPQVCIPWGHRMHLLGRYLWICCQMEARMRTHGMLGG